MVINTLSFVRYPLYHVLDYLYYVTDVIRVHSDWSSTKMTIDQTKIIGVQILYWITTKKISRVSIYIHLFVYLLVYYLVSLLYWDPLFLNRSLYKIHSIFVSTFHDNELQLCVTKTFILHWGALEMMAHVCSFLFRFCFLRID